MKLAFYVLLLAHLGQLRNLVYRPEIAKNPSNHYPLNSVVYRTLLWSGNFPIFPIQIFLCQSCARLSTISIILYKLSYVMHIKITTPMKATLQTLQAGSCCWLRIWAAAHVRRLKIFLYLSGFPKFCWVHQGYLYQHLSSPWVPGPTSGLTMGTNSQTRPLKWQGVGSDMPKWWIFDHIIVRMTWQPLLPLTLALGAVSNYLAGRSFDQSSGIREKLPLVLSAMEWDRTLKVRSRGLPGIGRRTLPVLAVRAHMWSLALLNVSLPL